MRNRARVGGAVAVGLWPLLSLLLALSITVPGRAQPAPPSSDLATEAQLHFDLGVDLYRQADYRGALEHLLLSNRLVPNKNVVFNIARCFEQLGRFAEAFRYYADFLAEETDPAGREGAERAIERIHSHVALLRVETDPAGAVVYIDRRDLGPRGTAPRTLALDDGTYRVLVELEGYAPAQSDPVAVRTGAEAAVHLSLTRILGRVRVTGNPAGAEIRVDAEDSPVLGRVPATVDVVPGPHVLIVSAPGRQSVQRVVRVVAGQTSRSVVSLPLEFGSLVVDAEEPGAEVQVDGRLVGTTPAVVASLPSGRHRIRVSLAGFRDYEEDVDVRPDRRTRIDVRLRLLREITAASREAQSVEDAPASVTLISQEEIRAFGYQTVFDALGGTRGIFQSDDRTYESIGVRGFSRPGDYGNHMLLTLDGHTMNDDQLGSSYVGYDLRSDLMDVERIEVVRGPGSVLYGTNAFFGVINLVTRDRETMLDPHASLGTGGIRFARARVGGGVRFSRTAGMWLSLGGVTSQGEDIRFAEYAIDGSDGVARDLDRFYDASVAGRGWLGDFTLEFSFNTRNKHIPTASFETIFDDGRETSRDTRGFVELRWEPRISRDFQLYARGYLDRYDFRGAFPYPVDVDPDTMERTGGVNFDAWDGTWTGAEARAVATAFSWLRITAGAEARVHFHSHLYSHGQFDRPPYYLDERPTFQVFSGYAMATARPVSWFSGSLGARFDYFDTPAYPVDHNSAISPRLALIFRPAQRDTIKLLGGSAFRAPSPYEFFYFDGGETQSQAAGLSPETVYTAEAEYTHRFSDELSVLGSVFFNEIRNLIDTVDQEPDATGATLFRYENLPDRVHTLGFEAEVRREWRSGWMVAASYSYQRTRIGDVFSDSADGESTRITNSPEHLFGFKGAAPIVHELATLATRLRVESPRYTVPLTDSTRTQWILLWDVMLTGIVRGAHLEYGFGVRNLFDWGYSYPGDSDIAPLLAVPQHGRTLYATATYTW